MLKYILIISLVISSVSLAANTKKKFVTVKAKTCKIASDPVESQKPLHKQKEPLLKCEVKEDK
jgi:hypothetical protein